MDGDEKIGMRCVGALGALEQPRIWPRRGDHAHGLVEAGIDECLLDHVGELEIEAVFGDSARAIGPW
jgi:hypothetical protein